MKELLDSLLRVDAQSALRKGNAVLLDTCFFINTFLSGKEKDLTRLFLLHNVYMTSFNAEELDYVKHRIPDRAREAIRRFLRRHGITIIDLPVHPGSRTLEEAYVRSIDPSLLKDVPDPSDAVLMAAAIATHATVLTKDRHDLFTIKLSAHLKRHGIAVLKDYHDILRLNR